MVDYAEVENIEELGADPQGSERTPNGNFSFYEGANENFAPNDLTGRARRAYDALRALDIHTLALSYNGGYDEGFAQLETAIGDAKSFSLAELIAQFKDGPLGEKIEKRDKSELNVWHPDESQVSREQWTEEAIWDLVETCATKLLGRSYGTGEASLYGRCRADLITGEITDIPTQVEELPADCDEKTENDEI